ncbi:ATPase H+ transporting accessory protein 1 like a isoform X2 [Chiloscyllium punctatum]|uniref:ATPase H+ transporting accessory protein 1 like a isoform X2 n=1 Tax=Chiloscyllium punctatum TaxID=137246 RepID=UPI003B63C2B7
METYKIQCLTISLLMTLSVTADHTVPVIMWSSAKALWKSVNIPHQEHNGSHKEALELFRYLSSAVNRGPKKVILFWQNKLNIHDIITVDGKLAHTFSNIQNALDSSPSSIILPAVNQHWTNQLPRYLQQKLGEDPILVNYLPFWNPGLSSTKSSLLIVKLSSRHRPAMVPDTKFLSDDDVIKLVTSALKANNITYTAIFTAGRSSQIVRHAFNEVMNTGRHLLQIPSWNQYPPINVTDGEMPCILFIAKKVTLRIGDQPEIDLTNRTFGSSAPKINTRDSTCTADKAMLSLNYGDVGNLKQLVIRSGLAWILCRSSTTIHYKQYSMHLKSMLQLQIHTTVNTSVVCRNMKHYSCPDSKKTEQDCGILPLWSFRFKALILKWDTLLQQETVPHSSHQLS